MMMKLFPRTQIDQILQELTQRDTKINLVDYFYQNTKVKKVLIILILSDWKLTRFSI